MNHPNIVMKKNRLYYQDPMISRHNRFLLSSVFLSNLKGSLHFEILNIISQNEKKTKHSNEFAP